MTVLHSLNKIAPYALATLACALLSACVEPRSREYRREVYTEPPPPPPITQVIFYPARGQTPEQQNRDRYECYQWAVQQTGFDPSQQTLAPHQRIEVVPAEPPGHDTAAGAVTGAILGAAVSRPREALGGALVGAMAGALIGASSDAARENEAARQQRRYDARAAQHVANVETQASNYRRAMTACLEGRGYQVK
jgi:hypothetical protein